jgi:hypothetical protein
MSATVVTDRPEAPAGPPKLGPAQLLLAQEQTLDAHLKSRADRVGGWDGGLPGARPPPRPGSPRTRGTRGACAGSLSGSGEVSGAL